MTVEITLSNGMVATVDDIDADLAKLRWHASCDKYSYAKRTEKKDGKRQAYLLHRVILERKVGRKLKRTELTDHKNLNTLDNRRKNLRVATKLQNQRNKHKYKNNRSGYKGVYLNRQKRWQVTIRVNGRNTSLGCFDTPEEAAMAYDSAAKEFFGEFANFNFPNNVKPFQGLPTMVNTNTSGYRGVSCDKRYNKWAACITCSGKRIALGYHDTPEEAAHAYDKAAKRLHGKKAKLNFPD